VQPLVHNALKIVGNPGVITISNGQPRKELLKKVGGNLVLPANLIGGQKPIEVDEHWLLLFSRAVLLYRLRNPL
jgi:hypothetical protein